MDIGAEIECCNLTDKLFTDLLMCLKATINQNLIECVGCMNYKDGQCVSYSKDLIYDVVDINYDYAWEDKGFNTHHIRICCEYPYPTKANEIVELLKKYKQEIINSFKIIMYFSNVDNLESYMNYCKEHFPKLAEITEEHVD